MVEGLAKWSEVDATGNSGSIDNIRTMMEDMYIGEEDTAEGDGLVGEEVAEAEGRGLGGGSIVTVRHRSPNSGG